MTHNFCHMGDTSSPLSKMGATRFKCKPKKNFARYSFQNQEYSSPGSCPELKHYCTVCWHQSTTLPWTSNDTLRQI